MSGPTKADLQAKVDELEAKLKRKGGGKAADLQARLERIFKRLPAAAGIK
jgi:predicted nucleic acid-binding Zn ribbon protein